MNKIQTEKQEAEQSLRKYLKKDSTIYCILAHCSQSGMTRDIKLMVCHKNELMHISWQVAKILNYPLKNHGVRIGGCGMDMGFALVNHLEKRLKIKLHHRWV
tara:strand:+ start:82 stop:387 length:306 start_codon:yes stop_codon:yes gene_type:complete